MKKAIVFGLVLVFLLVAGCNAGPGNKAGLYNFKQGISEVNFKFVENAPPEKLYQHSSFRMIVEVDNQAAYDVQSGRVTLVGLDETYFHLDQVEQGFGPLLGRSLTSPDGDKIFLEFTGMAKGLFPGSEVYYGPFFLKASYESTMEFGDSICLNSNLYAVYDAGCTTEASKSYGGQGAPLAVTNVETVFAPAGNGAGVEFRVKIANEGRGKVERAALQRAQLGGEELLCEFTDTPLDKKTAYFKEEKQETVLLCRSFVRDRRSYMTTLNLVFSYTYEVQEQHRLMLVK